MKTQKLIVIVAISCLLLGVSGGAAMADDCGDFGVLQNETFDGNLIIRGEASCTIIGSNIGGDLRLINVRSVLLLNNKVGGHIRVDGNEGGGGTANVIANTILSGYLVVRDYEIANVIENETLTDDIRVRNNISALVQKNIAAQKINCWSNTDLESFLNFAGQKLNCEN